MNEDNVSPELGRLLAKIDGSMSQEDYGRVSKSCSELIERSESEEISNEKLFVAYLNRGFARRRLRDLQGALDDARKAAQLNPRSFKPHMNAALVYAQDLGNYRKGLEEFDLALRLNPTDVEILSSRGLTKELMGDYPGAEADLRAALAIMPSDANALCNLGNLQWVRGKVPEAAEYFQKALTANPQDPELRVNVALALERMGSCHAAEEVLQVDRRAVALWNSKGGRHVQSPRRWWPIVLLLLLIVAGIVLAQWWLKVKMGGR
jgi:Flp pilus assembly protein TadD